MARTPVNSGYKTIEGSATGSNASIVDVWLEWKQLSKNVEANTSQVRVLLYAQCTGSSSTAWDVASKFGSVTCDGNQQYKSTTYNFANKAINCFGDHTFTVAHGTDGSKSVSLAGVFTTKSSYISGGSVSATTVALETIPRASSIAAAGNVPLGNACNITWTPNSASFRYKLKFSIGGLSYTTGVIHPNKTSAYTYTGYTIPLSVAEQITGSKTGKMSVVLTSYSDSGCTKVLGSDSETFTVTVPETDATRPEVTMTREAVQPPTMAKGSALYGLYLQGITRIHATEIAATGKYGADIDTTKYSLEVDGVSYGSSSQYLSDPVTKTGSVAVIGRAVDKRGIPGTVTENITVYPYRKPTLTATAYRCLSDKSPSDTGTFLKIDITGSSYAPVEVEGEAKNSIEIRWRYRAEKDKFPEEYNALSDDALLGGALAVDTAYEIEIMAVDLAGQKASVYVSIPTESIYRHKRAGGKGVGYGGYCEEDDLMDIHWNIRGRKAINGLYMRKVEHDTGSNVFQIKPKYAITGASYTIYQTFLVFGVCNATPVFGMLALASSGAYKWTGNGTVTAEVAADGVVTITLPAARTNPLTVISADPFEIAEE